MIEHWNGLPGMIVEAPFELGPGPGPGARARAGGDVLDWGPDCPPGARAGGGHSAGTILRGDLQYLILVALWILRSLRHRGYDISDFEVDSKNDSDQV